MNDSRCGKFRYFIPLFILAALAGFTLAVFLLWNGVLANVIAVKHISYWQALGLLVLAKILFGGFGGRKGPPFGRGRAWRRWKAMTPEEQAKLREEMRERFGDWPRPPWCDERPSNPGPSAPPAKP